MGGFTSRSAETIAMPTNSLPIELQAEIFGHLSPAQLYPSCFLLSKQSLAAVMSDPIWHKRCIKEFGEQLCEEKAKQDGFTTWFAMFKEHITMVSWDPFRTTFSEEQRKGLFEQDYGQLPRVKKGAVIPTDQICDELVFTGNIFTWLHPDRTSSAKCVAGNLRYSSGVHSFSFTCMEVRTYAIFGCGLMDDEIFDSRLFAYNAERKSDVADYLWWNDGGVYSALCEADHWGVDRMGTSWGVGKVIGVTVDFERRRVRFFLDDEHVFSIKMFSKTKVLRPVAIVEGGVSMKIEPKPATHRHLIPPRPRLFARPAYKGE